MSDDSSRRTPTTLTVRCAALHVPSDVERDGPQYLDGGEQIRLRAAKLAAPVAHVARIGDVDLRIEGLRGKLLHAAARRAFGNSFTLSAAAAVTIVVIAIPLAYFLVWRRSRLLRFVNVVTEIPYAVPGVVLAIAAILLFVKPIPVLGISIYNTLWIILFCYLARFLVLGLRPVVSGYHQLDRTLEEASQIAGARLARRLRTIILPLIAPTAAAGALLIFLTAFNELTLSALLWSSGSETLGVVFFSFQQGGDSTYAAALGVLTVAVSIALMLSTLLLAGRLPPGVLPCASTCASCCPFGSTS